MEGMTARRKKILWRAVSGLSEAGLPSMIRSTISFVETGEGSSGSTSLPSGPITFLGFLPFLPAGKRAEHEYPSRGPNQKRACRCVNKRQGCIQQSGRG